MKRGLVAALVAAAACSTSPPTAQVAPPEVAAPEVAVVKPRANLHDAIVSGKDDFEFARALVESGYPDLALQLLGVLESRSSDDELPAEAEYVSLQVAHDEARKIEVPLRREYALVKLLRDTEAFIDGYARGTQAAEDARNTLPDVFLSLVETFAAMSRTETDVTALDSLRSESDRIFRRSERAIGKRIDELKALDPRTDDVALKLMCAEYNHARTLYAHALLFPRGGGERVVLCRRALQEYDEFELTYGGGGDSLLVYFALVDSGNCLRELGKPDEAITQGYDRAIALRETFGEADAKTGLYPIPPDARDVLDLVCYAMLQKMSVLREQGKLDAANAVERDYELLKNAGR